MSDPKRASRILLLGWDAADWRFINPLLDAGLMPHLSKLVDGGTIANLATLNPCLSPLLWTSIATGKTADKHGITGFVEPIPGGTGIRLSTSTSRTTKAIWNILSQNQLTSVVINWYASHPAEPIRGACIANRFFEGLPVNPHGEWPIVPGSVHPESLRETISQFRMHPAELSPNELVRFIPEIARINLAKDSRPAKLAEIVARTVSTHSVATDLMERVPWDFLAVYYDAIDVAGHIFMPYHPPQMPTVSADDFRLYCRVMRELYLFHDEMLGRLLELAGDDTTVMLLSDHGFHSDHLRPANFSDQESEEALAALWHRHYGIFALRGPGILKDERIYGATLLDVAPTVLNLFGLPLGRDLDGRPLIQAYENPPQAIHSIPSWDQRPGADGRHPAAQQPSTEESRAAIEQLIALGYLPVASADEQAAVDVAVAESKFNLAIVHSSHGRHRQAVELLEELRAKYSGHTRYAIALAKAYSNLGQHQRCLEIVESLESSGWRSPEGDLLAAASLFNDGQIERALERIRESEGRNPPSAAFWNLVGNLHLAQQSWQSAEAAFEKSLGFDGEQPLAHNGIAQAALRQGQFEKSAEHALQAIGLLFFFPQAHFHLGMALKGMGEKARALRALSLAVSQAPKFPEAQQELENLKEELSIHPRSLTPQ